MRQPVAHQGELGLFMVGRQESWLVWVLSSGVELGALPRALHVSKIRLHPVHITAAS